ncbi:MAG TPA: hypothetical protein VGK45_12840 [Thermoanaerobaculia bacterium]
MRGSRVCRRPQSWLILSLLFLLLLPLCVACQGKASSPAASSGSAASSSESESERTRKIQEKAADIERKAAEIQNMQGTEQEKTDAVNALDKERRELTEMQESKN